MPGDSEDEAIALYVAKLEESLWCITDARLVLRPDTKFQYSAKFGGITPAAVLSTSGLLLLFAQGFSVQQNAGALQVTLETYIYTVKAEQKGPLFSYEWHPRSHRTDTHFQIKQGVSLRGMNKCHFPTGHIAIEQVVRFLIVEMKVPALRPDWDQVLTTNQKRAET